LKENKLKENRIRNKSEVPIEDSPKPEIPPVKPFSGGKTLESFISILKSERFKQTTGILLCATAVFLFFALLSHFFTGNVDQDLAEAGPGGVGEESARNWLGTLGAWCASQLITKGVGFIGIAIPILLGVLGLNCLDSKYSSLTWRISKELLFILPWAALSGGWIAQVFKLKSMDWGGNLGIWLNTSLYHYIGNAGLGIIICATGIAYFILHFKVTWNQLFPPPKEVGNITSEPLDSADLMHDEKTNDLIINKETSEKKALEKKEEQDEFILNDNLPEEESGSFYFELSSPSGTPKKNTAQKEAKPIPEEISFTYEKPENKDIADDILLDHTNILLTADDKIEKLIPESDIDKSDELISVENWELYDPKAELRGYKPPPVDLLNPQPASQSPELEKQELLANKEKIERTLRNYGIEIVSIKATIGPTVTLYEIVPAPGIKISRIRNLEDDIALSLSAMGIRIIAPIPGKGTIGIEIPNSNPEIVTFRSVIGTDKFRESTAELPIAIGKTITNEVYIADLTKMPHLLIAGATGQGKSVGLNNIIASILYKRHPSEVKFVLIDPKKVEMPLYQPILNHFLAKMPNYEDAIITDTRQVIHVLTSLCKEMDNRYDLLKMASTRNLREYNSKFLNRRLNPLKGHRFFPYIVLVIDELADLMMTAGKEVEMPIARLAQLARAVGIHLVVATQRPSVNVITGIIKANFPTRISYRVSSKIDSRTILDQGGADQLIGRGDLLLSTGNDLIRIQNAFIDTPEVEKMVDFIGNQTSYSEPYLLPEVYDENDKEEDTDFDAGDRDRMFEEAARLVVRHQQGSTSLIQRRLSLGYNRAGRIMDQLERAGIVGPNNGSKAREVLFHSEPDLEQFLTRGA
jgi:S-DNA-T family DNA segregation ATPase FtsK/SpoIIIE